MSNQTRPTSKIIQILTIDSDKRVADDQTIVALCQDGSLWQLPDFSEHYLRDWVRILEPLTEAKEEHKTALKKGGG